MNAIDPLPSRAIGDDAAGAEPPLTTATEALAWARRLTWALAGVAAILAVASARGVPAVPVVSAALAGLAATAATWHLAWARRCAMSPAEESRSGGRFTRLLPRRAPRGDAALIGRAARLPQAAIVVPFAAAGIVVAALLHPNFAALTSRADFLSGGGAFLLAFPLLIAEQALGTPRASATLPEAQPLRALLFVFLLCLAGSGLLAIAAGLGYASAANVGALVLTLPPLLIAAELALRALGRLFLPAPRPDAARAAATSTLALILADAAAAHGLAAPVRRHLGLDFTRGWALAFVRAALPAVTLCILLIVWGLTGIVPVPQDQRAIYERFGAPVAVLHPGMHAILPWPLGRVRRVEFGPLHAIPLGDGFETTPSFGAEDAPPDAVNRLWEQPHPAELSFLIASESAGRQNFQIVSADIKAVWRVGLTDADALRASYAVADPAILLRGAASRAVAVFFAGETLPSVLGEAREAVAERLRMSVQRELDRIGAGIELTAVVIEAIHPPAGAAVAWHAVQAAEITSVTQISAERGRAQSEGAKAAQFAAEIVANAHARAADVTGEARTQAILFSADVQAAHGGETAFLFNRYLSDVASALSVAPLTIIDHRIPEADAPMLDLRPLSGQPAPSTGAE